VIDFYDLAAGTFLGGPKEIHALHLSDPEKSWLEEFLKTLTGDAVPEVYLRDLHDQ